MGLILSKNGRRGGLDIRPLSSARARARSYGWFERWWRSSQRGSTCSYHYLNWPVGLSHSTKTVSQCLFLFSLKLTVCSSSETAWVIYSRTALLFTLNYLSSGSFCAPRCQNPPPDSRPGGFDRSGFGLQLSGGVSKCFTEEEGGQIGHVAYMLTSRNLFSLFM